MLLSAEDAFRMRESSGSEILDSCSDSNFSSDQEFSSDLESCSILESCSELEFSPDLECTPDYENDSIVTETIPQLEIDEYFNFIAKIPHFSKEDLPPCHTFDFEIYDKKEYHNFTLKVYTDGCSKGSKGYVSIFIRVLDRYNVNRISDFRKTCIMSILDVASNHEFSQSFEIPFNGPVDVSDLPAFGFDKFVKREIPFSNQSDFLPGDTLTVCVRMSLKTSLNPVFDTIHYGLPTSYSEIERLSQIKCSLNLDSLLVQRLSAYSEYFQRILTTPMIENERRFVDINGYELHVLHIIVSILRGCYYENITMYGIYALHNVACYYRIERIVDICREFLKTILSRKNMSVISQIAEMYEDDHLKKAIDILKAEIKDEVEGNNEAFCLREKSEQRHEITYYTLCINDRNEEINEDENSNHEFYM